MKALVVIEGEISEKELIEFCRSKLAHYKCPTSIEFRENSQELQQENFRNINYEPLLGGSRQTRELKETFMAGDAYQVIKKFWKKTRFRRLHNNRAPLRGKMLFLWTPYMELFKDGGENLGHSF
ncbi:MAG: hypothetical protein Ct9H90mP5_04250 [Acidimicrobiaceae bacterium]|nr:MAG: hypothetical protein Ct9H90mP5_04250 [Acidimicrobiaceae bacterium]